MVEWQIRKTRVGILEFQIKRKGRTEKEDEQAANKDMY
jgi:hypothetical protein